MDMLQIENEQQVAYWLERHGHWFKLLPLTHGTDI